MLGELFGGLINILFGAAFDETGDRIHRRWGTSGCFLIAGAIVVAVCVLIAVLL